MALFFLSFIMVFISAYFIASILNKENNIFGLIYIFLIAFANIVFSVEVLSLFSQISPIGVLIMNLLIILTSSYFWVKFGKPFWHINCKPFFKQVRNALNLDKSLYVLLVCFLFFISVSIYLCFLMPVVNSDATAYHVLRSVYWIVNKNLNHFAISDSRNLYLPINSEILYAWVIMFVKKQVWLGFFSFVGYILSMISTYKILDLMKYSMRKKLWVIFMLSSFASVIVQASGTETDIIIAGLVSSSLMLFAYGVKDNNKIPVIISAVAYALALGTKTPSIFPIPAIGIAMVLISYHYKKKEFYKPFMTFLITGLIGFIVLSSYNYVLNFINYGNIAGSKSFLIAHKNFEGLKAIPANFIKYMFLFFDFTGFKWGTYLSKFLIGIRDSIIFNLDLYTIEDGVYTTTNVINQTMLEPLMGLGILGMLVFVPCWLWSMIKPIFVHDKRTFIIGFFGWMFLLNVLIMSYQLQFMTFSVRFIMFLVVISAPILVLSYKKRGIGKVIVIIFAVFYLTLVSSHLWARKLMGVINFYKTGYTTTQIREMAICTGLTPRKVKKLNYKAYKEFVDSGQCTLPNYIKAHFNKENKILYFSNTLDDLLMLQMMNLYGYHIDTGLMENIDNIDLNKYNLILTINDIQTATNITHYKERISDMKMKYSNDGGAAAVFTKYKENSCLYYSKPGDQGLIFDRKIATEYPYLDICNLTQKYYKQHNLKYISKIKYEINVSVNSNKYDDMNILFYENLNNPIIK